jgi:hypothetical protein
VTEVALPQAKENRMRTAQAAARSAYAPSDRQQSVRCHSSGLPLQRAVRFAVDVFFHFDSRATRGIALWSETEHVWMGSETYLHWAIWDADIDIPWVVATATGAPEDAQKLRDAVRTELISYWRHRTASLPRRGFPQWLPLP